MIKFLSPEKQQPPDCELWALLTVTPARVHVRGYARESDRPVPRTELSSLCPGLFLGRGPGVGEEDDFAEVDRGPDGVQKAQGWGRKGLGTFWLSRCRQTEAGIRGQTREGPRLARTLLLLLAGASQSDRG